MSFSLKPTLALATALLLLGAPLGCTDAPDTKRPDGSIELAGTPAPGAAEDLGPAPDFSATTLAGQPVRLSDFEGDVLVVNFWATWCAPCIVETPDLVELYESHKDEGFHLLGVSLDYDGPGPVEAFGHEYGITYPLILDDTGELSEAFGGVYGLPMTFIIGPDGTLVRQIMGMVPMDTTKPLIEKLLAARS